MHICEGAQEKGPIDQKMKNELLMFYESIVSQLFVSQISSEYLKVIHTIPWITVRYFNDSKR